ADPAGRGEPGAATGDPWPGAAGHPDRAWRLDQCELRGAGLRHRFPEVRRPVVAADRLLRRLRAVAWHRCRLRGRAAWWRGADRDPDDPPDHGDGGVRLPARAGGEAAAHSRNAWLGEPARPADAGPGRPRHCQRQAGTAAVDRGRPQRRRDPAVVRAGVTAGAPALTGGVMSDALRPAAKQYWDLTKPRVRSEERRGGREGRARG